MSDDIAIARLVAQLQLLKDENDRLKRQLVSLSRVVSGRSPGGGLDEEIKQWANNLLGVWDNPPMHL